MKKIENSIKSLLKKRIPDIRPGDTVRVYQKIPALKKGKKAKDKERIQIFEGIVLARKHGKEAGATITVRKVIAGIGVEKIFPLYLPTIKKIEVLKRSKVRRAKLYYLRKAKGKRSRLKRLDYTQPKEELEPVAEPSPAETPEGQEKKEEPVKEKPKSKQEEKPVEEKSKEQKLETEK